MNKILLSLVSTVVLTSGIAQANMSIANKAESIQKIQQTAVKFLPPVDVSQNIDTSYGSRHYFATDGYPIFGSARFKYQQNGSSLIVDFDKLIKTVNGFTIERLFTRDERLNQLIQFDAQTYFAIKEYYSGAQTRILVALDNNGVEQASINYTVKDNNYLIMEKINDIVFLKDSGGNISIVNYDTQSSKFSITNVGRVFTNVAMTPVIFTATKEKIVVQGSLKVTIFRNINGVYQVDQNSPNYSIDQVLENGDWVSFPYNQIKITNEKGRNTVININSIRPDKLFLLENGNFILFGKKLGKDTYYNFTLDRTYLYSLEAMTNGTYSVTQIVLPKAELVDFSQFIKLKDGSFAGVVDRNQFYSKNPDDNKGMYKTDDIVVYTLSSDKKSVTFQNIQKIPDDKFITSEGKIFELPDGSIYYNGYLSRRLVFPIGQQ